MEPPTSTGFATETSSGLTFKPWAARLRQLSKKPPPTSDPVWAELAGPLLEFLAEARTWRELYDWSRQVHYGESLLTHVLAWADQERHIESFYEKTSENKTELVWIVGIARRLERRKRKRPVFGELDERSVHSGLVGSDREGEGDDDPVVSGVSSPKDEFMGPPFDDGDA
jgi:hypothetical protein